MDFYSNREFGTCQNWGKTPIPFVIGEASYPGSENVTVQYSSYPSYISGLYSFSRASGKQHRQSKVIISIAHLGVGFTYRIQNPTSLFAISSINL